MRTPFRYLGLIIFCAFLSGCFSWSNLTSTPAPSRIIPASEPIIPLNTASSIKNVALLLPLEGPLGNAGQAVRDGFITAYNSDTSTHKPAHFIIIDTYNQNIVDAYQKAVKADADIIVGPLERNNVQALVQANAISISTLSLNYLDTKAATPNKLYQFGLSPVDEARQVAALAKQNSAQNAVILVPNNSWGQTLAQTYRDEWQALGGNVISTLSYSEDSSALNNQVRNLANNQKLKFDTILLAATPQIARQIKPLLKFYNLGDVPVYATSLVYTGSPQPAFDTDLNGVTFCDMPWTLSNNPADIKLRQQIALFWSANYKQNARLYALGIDAYSLVKKLPQLAASQRTITGATGNLFLNNQRLVVRQLTCAQFNKGIPVVLTSDTEATATDDASDNNNVPDNDDANIKSAMDIINNAANQTDQQN